MASNPKLPWLTRQMIAEAKETVYPGGKQPSAEERREELGQNGLPAPASNPTAHHCDDVLLGITADDVGRKPVVREVPPKRDGHELNPNGVVVRVFAPTSRKVVDGLDMGV